MNDKYRGLIMILTILTWGCFLTTPSFAPIHDAQALLKKIDNYRVPYEKFLITTEITSFEQNRIKETAVFDAYIDGYNKSLVIARTYKTKGMKILYVNENMWVHLPNSRRPIRITPVQRLMGQASNGDVARVGDIAD